MKKKKITTNKKFKIEQKSSVFLIIKRKNKYLSNNK